MTKPKKSLGQHWLTDRTVLGEIAESAELTPNDVVLEIGPGLGTLTSELLKRAGSVTAVEFDQDLARKLPGQFPGTRLTVVHEDILNFPLESLPDKYKVVANVPYYITSKIVQKLLTSENKPSIVVLLVQKEVAERLAAKPGQMSLLSLSAQIYADVSLGVVVPAHFFTPPPEVDSRIVILKLHSELPNLQGLREQDLFRVARAGFGERRKKLRNSLAGGLRMSQSEIDDILQRLGFSPDVRAQELTVEDWIRLSRAVQ